MNFCMVFLRFICLCILSISSVAYGKVYDCFIFFDELELLEVRLNELADVVDKFVLVEMAETFQGNKKRFIFKENQHLFEKFSDKIIYIKLSDRLVTPSPWVREAFQRNQIMRGLSECNDEDIILISDADEIVRCDAVAKIKEALKQYSFVRCKQRTFRFYLNMETRPWCGTFAVLFKYLKQADIDQLRKLYIHKQPPASLLFFDLPNAGWHFSSVGGLERFKTKLESYAHAGSTEYYKSQAYIDHIINTECRCVELDDSFPWFVTENIEMFSAKGFICK